ncbi:MAG TPA: OsmC family protein [Anaerolineae bacterium]|nr:OsmC family protein [Anaerolineae bacterium]
MGEASVQWISGGRFVGIDSTQHSVVMSTAEEGVGIKPSDMLLLALGACSAVDVVKILEKKRMALQALDIKVNGEQDAEAPWTFRKVHLAYVLCGKDLTEKAVQQAIELSEDGYCSVASTVRGIAEITHSYQIMEECE